MSSDGSAEQPIGLAASPRFRPYDEALKKRLAQLSQAFYGCHLAFGAAIDANPAGHADSSPADLDRRHFELHEPPYPPTALVLVSTQSYFYLSAAAEHMRGLGALYGKEEVLIPPPALIRCVLEYSARVMWLLEDEDLAPEDRLARAYLEQLSSAVERKKTNGRLMGKDSEAYRADAKALADLRRSASEVFGEKVVDDDGQHRIRGQRMPGLEDCVAQMFQRLRADPAVSDHRGIYDYVSNISHPTVYPHIEMWQVVEVDGGRSFTSAITVEDHDRRAAMAIRPFCEALKHVILYNGWNYEPFDQLSKVLEALLPDASGSVV